MKKNLFLFFFLVSMHFNLHSQQTVGLFNNSPEAFDGYTLFAPIGSTETYLINNCGEKVHTWSSDYSPGLSCYLLENGILVRTGKVLGNPGSGIVEMIDWDGNVIWDYSSTPTHGRQHHDIEVLPNGNILLIVRDRKTPEEVTLAGSSTNNEFLDSEQIIEVQPDLDSGGASVVWEWKAWDHLIQDTDMSLDSFGIISEHPERIDINFANHTSTDWLHFNGIDYHEEFDQIIVSVRKFSEFWIIDHSTTTAEAAGSSAGKYGNGGDLLYRWGNPQTYDQGSPEDQKLFLQHDAQWIREPLADAGKIILFNNQAGNPLGQGFSSVDAVNSPVDANGFYAFNGEAFGPSIFDWSYLAPNPTDFFSDKFSGVQRLKNGNTLICEGVGGRFFEVDENENIAWEYINPVNESGPIEQGTTATQNNVFRCTRYAPDYPGFEGRILDPQGYIETGSTYSCDLFPVAISSEKLIEKRPAISPNPAIDIIRINTISQQSEDLFIKIFSPNGQQLINRMMPKGNNELVLDVMELNNGIYFVVMSNDSEVWTDKIIVSK